MEQETNLTLMQIAGLFKTLDDDNRHYLIADLLDTLDWSYGTELQESITEDIEEAGEFVEVADDIRQAVSALDRRHAVAMAFLPECTLIRLNEDHEE